MTAAQEAASSAEQYRRERQPCSSELRVELARITDDIDDPVVKLRYLRAAIERGDATRITRVPFGPVRRALYRLLGLESLDAVAGATIGAKTLAARARARRFIAGALAGALLLVPALLVGLAVRREPPPPAAISAAPAPAVVEPARPQPPVEPLPESLPEDALGVVPGTIWLADRGPGWELYSNGLRIETTYAVRGGQREYRIHHRDGTLEPDVYSKPAGILFHTSESDLWPLEADFARELRRGTVGLLHYLQKQESYNYLIDRFGRVYRIVDDESRANHAGHSVWARGDEVYLDLNSAFLGVSFESRWDGGRSLPITRAQLIAGRNLTHYLRQRFAIAPEMCVTHGLTSVSPRQGLIGYHRDWARGFPFEAFGLPDLYAVPPPSVALFGFGHDDEFLRAIGEPWPGLVAAEQALTEEARQRALPLEAVRRERQALYRKWSTNRG
ncbi:MAG TPA: peptidoglycan recognition family protein [Steroidobacteraceae bacterium]|nr:peptidoglycan recognition family protein [Steroidobacteraceae bacterium]